MALIKSNRVLQEKIALLELENSQLRIKTEELESRLKAERETSKKIIRLNNIENIPDDQIEVLELIERCFTKLAENNPKLKEKVENLKMMIELLRTVIKSK